MKVVDAIVFTLLSCATISANEPINIGSRLELMIDHHLIDTSDGVRLQLHKPVRRNVALVTDAPWEGNACTYSSVFQDGDRYRLYFGSHHYVNAKGKLVYPHEPYTCYAESEDGIHWTKPKLGLIDFDGSKENNIVLAAGSIKEIPVDPGHIAVFKDSNPQCPEDARYKAVIRSGSAKGLYALKSPDGFHFSPLSNQLIITDGAFDSQNLAFWDAIRGEYRAYFRDFLDGVRGIKTATSKDFVKWSKPEWLAFPGAPNEQLYTNQVAPYERAPHIFFGFPMRYTDRGDVDSTGKLPQLELRRQRASASPRYGSAVTDGLMMTSRDGLTFKRWGEAIIRPGPSRTDSWVYGDNIISWGILKTKSGQFEAPDELSIYATEGYWTGKSQNFRRYSIRVDGFVSMQAPLSGGEFVTKPLLFEGDKLAINYSTSAAGGIWVEIQDAKGQPLQGYAKADCHEIFGDEIRRQVIWQKSGKLGELASKPVRLRFVLKDADLFSFRFE
ncbi:MAG: hypothetical protein CMJ64_25490 [Planctomycetaceae bacterium]|nr:hypothetical protein [Planctomycetaceae bacterium]